MDETRFDAPFDVNSQETFNIAEAAKRCVKRMSDSGEFAWNQQLWEDQIAWTILNEIKNEKIRLRLLLQQDGIGSSSDREEST